MSEATRAALAAAVNTYLAECEAAAIPGTVARDGMEVAALAHLRSEPGLEHDLPDAAAVTAHRLALRVLADEPVPGEWVPATAAPGARYWHGTIRGFLPGDVLTPEGANAAGRRHPESDPRYLYFTGVAADAAPHGPHVYQVVPVAAFEKDDSVYDEGYRTAGGLEIVG